MTAKWDEQPVTVTTATGDRRAAMPPCAHCGHTHFFFVSAIAANIYVCKFCGEAERYPKDMRVDWIYDDVGQGCTSR